MLAIGCIIRVSGLLVGAEMYPNYHCIVGYCVTCERLSVSREKYAIYDMIWGEKLYPRISPKTTTNLYNLQEISRISS